jgi:hypothetical protein
MSAELPPAIAAVLHRIEQKHTKAKRWRWVAFAVGLVVGVIVGRVV